jgi:Xaa-Pro aminopeptidase
VSGSSVHERSGQAQRLERVRDAMREHGLDALLVQGLLDIRYLTSFTGSNALLILAAEPSGSDEAGVDRFLTDFRYEDQSAEQVPAGFARVIVKGNLLDAVAGVLAQRGGRLGFDEEGLSFGAHERLRASVERAWELVPSGGVLRATRMVKDAGEIERMRAAAQLADAALSRLLEDGLAGRSERDVAIDLEARMRRLGAEAASFPTIVAAAEHGARPHAVPRAQTIAKDVLVTIDWGALHEGYCSDCTRTYATGEAISEQAREVYELVRRAQEEGLAAVRPGLNGRELDAVARAVVEAGGHGKHFGHGLGHGVGMDIHEGPRLGRDGTLEPLVTGNVVTIEPGVYLPGELGVRIEDLVAVSEDGADVLNGLPKDLTVIG